MEEIAMNIDLLDLVLRETHIFAGIFWAGSSFLLTAFLGPSVQATAPEGGKVMQHLLAKTRFIATISAAAALSAVSGVWLYIRESGNFQTAWMQTSTGLALTLAGGLGVLTFFHAFFGIGKTNQKIAGLAREIMAGGNPPTPEQGSELQSLQIKAASQGRITALLLVLVIVGMAASEAL
jgi:uncharacterized membrane protein